jgi:hypothetical protein
MAGLDPAIQAAPKGQNSAGWRKRRREDAWVKPAHDED